MAKTYNPFKIWGSWGGALVTWFGMAWIGCVGGCSSTQFWEGFFRIFTDLGHNPVNSLSLFLIIGLGFFAGYGIHLMIRSAVK